MPAPRLTAIQKKRIRSLFMLGYSSKEIADISGIAQPRVAKLIPLPVRMRQLKRQQDNFNKLAIPGDSSTIKPKQ